MTNAKIVLGGLGLTNSGSDLECHSFNFGDDMISLGLAGILKLSIQNKLRMN